MNARDKLALWLQARWYLPRKPPLVLRPLAWLFGLLAWLRRRLYALGLLRAVRLPVRVVIVGNISAGGSGKSPLVAWLARALAGAGLRVGIVVRGYGSGQRNTQVVHAETDPAAAGDEAVWLARITGVLVAAGCDRVAAARRLLADGPLDLILSDDGLQHYRLARDVEIVALDAGRGFGNGALLPAGPLREPPHRIVRAAAVVLKGNGNPQVPAGPPVFRMHCSLAEAIRLSDGIVRPLTAFRGMRVRALAGIAHPEGFFAALEGAGLVIERIPLPDHGPVARVVDRLPADLPLLMTDKDAVKLRSGPGHAWRVPLAVRFSEDEGRALLAIVRGEPESRRVEE